MPCLQRCLVVTAAVFFAAVVNVSAHGYMNQPLSRPLKSNLQIGDWATWGDVEYTPNQVRSSCPSASPTPRAVHVRAFDY